MITGEYWFSKNRSCKAILLEKISSVTAYVMIINYPDGSDMYSTKVCRARISKSIDKINWDKPASKYSGYYIHNT